GPDGGELGQHLALGQLDHPRRNLVEGEGGGPAAEPFEQRGHAGTPAGAVPIPVPDAIPAPVPVAKPVPTGSASTATAPGTTSRVKVCPASTSTSPSCSNHTDRPSVRSMVTRRPRA